MAINAQTLQVLAQVMTLNDADKAALVQALVALGTQGSAQVSAPIAQAEPVTQAPVQTQEVSATDTIVHTALSADGKGVEFYTLGAHGQRKSAMVFMAGVKELIADEGNGIVLAWDATLESSDTYHSDYVGKDGVMHPYGTHKRGAYVLTVGGKALGKAKVAEFVKAHEEFVLTAERKDAYKASKADKDAKRLERERKVLAKYGYKLPQA